MRALALVPALTLALMLALPAGAEHCLTWTTSSPEVTTPATGVSLSDTLGTGEGGDGTYYVDNDPCNIGCIFSIWVYEESNGIPGLQRGDEFVDDTCHRQIRGDTIIL